jgi:NitT/TauT family transport system ATP-binding protein
MIQMSRVSRSFHSRRGAVEALRGVDLDVRDGEFIALVGRSGCGKSTLLRLVAGLVSVSAGRISIDGTPVTGPRQDVALMFQTPALLPWRTVIDNVLLPVEIFGWNRREYRDQALQLLDTVGLADFEKRLPHELSGGMQQRVALCRSLIQQPRVLLMDEPFSALDAITREELAIELQRIHMKQGATTVFVTHSISEAVLLADRVAVLTPRPGRILQVMDIDIPRPRSLGVTSHLDDVARCTAELHELLAVNDARAFPPVQGTG